MVQRTNKNIRLMKKFKEDIKKNIKVDRFIFFGSRARGKFKRYSDFDVLIVSPNFKGVTWYKRPTKFYLIWKEDYPLELLCYTPEEFNKRSKKIGIVSEAVREGIEI